MSAQQLEIAAKLLGPIIDDVVFVGGATVHLWLTDPDAPPARATADVDVICEVTTRAEYYRLGARLRECGLQEADGEPILCRWRSTKPPLIIDAMPTDPTVLGFSNPWYEQAILSAAPVSLNSGAQIRAARPTMLVATKLCAWKGRGWSKNSRPHRRPFAPTSSTSLPSFVPSPTSTTRSRVRPQAMDRWVRTAPESSGLALTS